MNPASISQAPVRPVRRTSRIFSADVAVFNIISCVLLGVFAILCVLPFYLIIVASFSSEQFLLTKGHSLTIQGFTLEAYRLALMNSRGILNAYINTILLTLIGTSCAVFIATMTGYVLSRKDFPWRNRFSFFFFFTTLFSGGLVPTYIMCVRYLNFKNNWLALILPMLFSVWNMILSKNYMKSIPDAITESAKADGANDFRIYIQLILPLSMPLVATLLLFTGLAFWNDWMHCLLYINNRSMFTLQFFLQPLLGSIEMLREAAQFSRIEIPVLPEESLKMAMTVIVTGPIILLYPFLQRYFVKGLTVGAVKG